MTSINIDQSRRRAAKLSAVAYLVSFASVVFAQFRIHDHLIVSHNPSLTAKNILEHEQLFRVGIACDLTNCVATVVFLAALCVIFWPVSRGLSLVAAFMRFVYALAWILMSLNLFDALRLLRGAGAGQLFDAAPAWANFYLSARFDQYYVGLLFAGLASAVCAYLWLKSRYIPKWLAGFGLISSLFCAICTFIFIISPDFERIVGLAWFDTPMGIFDLLTSFWLLFRGLRAPQ
jgi:Domain of unknown function (DUF4386)